MKRRISKKESLLSQNNTITTDQLENLKQIMPQIFTEGKVDFGKLKETLGEFENIDSERYSFSWAGKRNSIRLLQLPTRSTLIPCNEESVNGKNTDNIFIEGENLEVLKLLLKSYYGRVKMIYIDPPYNTGNDFIYTDDYTDPLDTYLKLTGQKDSKGNMLTNNPETGGRYHSNWLSMMYPRLFIARQLLSEDGTILISIDDHEIYNLRLILNEIFGEEGYLATFVWRRRIGSSMATSWVSTDHEYIVAYSKNPEHVYVRGDDRDMAKYSIPDGKGKYYASMPLTVGMTKAMRPNQWYELKKPGMDKGYWPPEGRVWGFYPPTMEQKIKEDKIIWPEDYPEKRLTTPRIKTYPEDAKRDRKPISTWVLEKNTKEVENDSSFNISSAKNEEGTRILKDLLGDTSFSYPKPISLLKSLVEQFTKADDIIMDFFAGSGTLAQAVLEVNREDGGKRKFLLVQLPEKTNTSQFSTIAEIGKERIRRVIERMKVKSIKAGIQEESEDLGFKVFKLAESNFKKWEDVNPNVDAFLSKSLVIIDPLLPGWIEENVIYEVALKEGYNLNIQINPTQIGTVLQIIDPINDLTAKTV